MDTAISSWKHVANGSLVAMVSCACGPPRRGARMPGGPSGCGDGDSYIFEPQYIISTYVHV
jgi:hypothetical protein